MNKLIDEWTNTGEGKALSYSRILINTEGMIELDNLQGLLKLVDESLIRKMFKWSQRIFTQITYLIQLGKIITTVEKPGRCHL